MTYRLPVALAVTLALSGCMAPLAGNVGKPGVTGGTVTMQTRVAKVETMTRTFSVAKNPGLSKAAASFKELAGALQSAFGATSSAVGARRGYSVEEAASTVRAGGLKAAYHITGMADHGDAKLFYDDATGEVTAIEGANARISFKLVTSGNTRVWDAVIEKSPDGTTGKFHLEVKGGWGANPFVPPTAPERSLLEAETGATIGVEAPPAPFKWFNNEYPRTVEAVSFSLDLLPKGDAALAFKLAGSFDEPASLPNSDLRAPTHWKLDAQLPKLAFDWESHLKLAAGGATFDALGTLAVDGEGGKDQFTYVAKADERSRTGSFALTNVAARVTLLLSGSQKSVLAQPVVKSVLISAEDGSQLGTVALDPSRPRFAVITFNDDTKLDWELYPADLFPQPAFGQAAQRPARPPAS